MHWGSFWVGIAVAYAIPAVGVLALVAWDRWWILPRARPTLHLLGRLESPEEHCRNALQLLEELQREMLKDPRTAVPLVHEGLRLLAAARQRVWMAVWRLEAPRDNVS